MDVDNLKKEIADMQASGSSVEEVAAFAYQRINEIKQPVIEATSSDFLNQIKERNIKEYGNSAGPTFEQFINSGRTF